MSHAAFLRAIHANPDDDTPRLVYADWLAETGDPDRGEFIRVQCDLARLDQADPRRPALEDREHELLAEHEPRWIGEPADLHEWRFERGFLSEIATTPWAMRGCGSDLFANHPIRRWRVMTGDRDMSPDSLVFSESGWTARLEALDFAGSFQWISELEHFLTRANLERLRELDLTGREDVDDLPHILARCPFRDALTVLRCGGGYDGEMRALDVRDLVRTLDWCELAELAVPGTMLDADDLRTLLASNGGQSLTSLDISDNGIEPDGWEAFLSARCRLRELDLSGTPLGAITLDRLLQCPAAGELRALHLNRCGSAMANTAALARSRFWQQAEELRMRGGTVPTHALDPLFAGDGPPRLRILDVSENYLRDAGVAALCNAPWAGSLTWLGLSQNYLTDESLRTIAASGRFAYLRTLHLGDNNAFQDGATVHEVITDAGVKALAESPSLANLRQIGLQRTDVGNAGVDWLINGPHWRLSGIGLAACSVGEPAVRIMANSPRLARLEWLDLSDNAYLGGRVLQALAESPYLSPLMELDVRRIPIDPVVRDALRQRLGRRLSE